MKTIMDNTRRAESIIRRALTQSLHSHLMVETRRMLEAGAALEDIVWMLSPDDGIAERRQDVLAFLDEEFPHMAYLVRDLPVRVQGRMLVVYLGPEGIFAQVWKSMWTSNMPSA